MGQLIQVNNEHASMAERFAIASQNISRDSPLIIPVTRPKGKMPVRLVQRAGRPLSRWH